ncbi:MAG TPA: adenylate/guanylate cyclase domain-containing protein [Anaerolineaceae bacterium]|nr:adenylate/guanylate cyclase domain-containing protein [Anaerolineaceae bacterium]
MTENRGNILVVDDDMLNRILISTNLEEEGFTVEMAENGRQALDILRHNPFDVVLLDLIMPEMDGFQVLETLKADSTLRHIPVIVISAVEEMESVVRCIEMGAMDHLPKPFDPVLLHARINASLASKRLHDVEQAYLKQIEAEQQKSEGLLLNILPIAIAEQLKQGQGVIADYFPDVTVLFADLVNFTPYAARHTPTEVLELLNAIFSTFDQLVERQGLEKIKTIGDSYMVAGGLPRPHPDALGAMADLALDIQSNMARLVREGRIEPFEIRVGFHSGPVIAGVIGKKKFAYDMWGDTVNTASRIQDNSQGNKTLVSEAVRNRLNDRYLFQENGVVPLKGLREMMTYWLVGRK